MSECDHELFYYPETNEAGWRCCHCDHKPGEPPGFSPQLDREQIDTKVGSILLDLHNGNFVHVSNGTGGEVLTEMVAERCKAEGRYDQYSIALFILEAMTARHAAYWREISDGIIAGKDPRPRCDCGKLPSIYTDGKQYCWECREKTRGEEPW